MSAELAAMAGIQAYYERIGATPDALAAVASVITRLKGEEQRITAARNEGREEGLVAGFADCEALVIVMAHGQAAVLKDVSTPSVFTPQDRAVFAFALESFALAVQLGQHRTDAYDAELIATAHRKAAWPSQVAKMNKARALALSPERKKEIALIASNAASTARRARAKEKE